MRTLDKLSDLEYVKCDVCGFDETAKLRSFKPFNLVRCKRCGLIYINPRLKDVSAQYECGESSPFAYYIRNKNADARAFLFILEILSKYKKTGRLLDVGCGVGTFLLAALDRGYKVKGVDINSHCVKYCQKELSLDVEYGLSDKFYYDVRFDVVTLLSVIEHLPHPSRTLQALKDVLSDKGIIIIATMNADSLAARVFQIKPKEHLYYFNPRTIEKILEVCGFRMLELKKYDPYRDMASLYFSSTFKDRTVMRFGLNIIRMLSGRRGLPVKFSFNENILVIAEKT